MTRIRKLFALLIGVILLSMWSNAIAAVFCPHMSGNHDGCLMQLSHEHGPNPVDDSQAQASQMQMTHTMCDTDISSMVMGEMDTDASTASLPKSTDDLANNGAMQVMATEQLSAEAFTLPYEPCSHCMMHSRSRAIFPVSIPDQNNPSYQVVAADVATGMLKSVPPSLTFVELHDHSPPGSSAALYVLVSAFRI